MRFGIIGNTSKDVLGKVGRDLFAFLAKRKIPFVVDEVLAKWFASHHRGVRIPAKSICTTSRLPRSCDVLIALGGDGTMLAASRIVGNTEIPILGVNLGKLGFLAEFSTKEMQGCILDILRGDYLVENRMVLEAKSLSDNHVFHGLNDIVIDKGGSMRVIEIETKVNDEYLVTYQADGIIVSTPTGSTAYSLAGGGPIVVPEANVMMINPIAPHTLTARAVIVPNTCVISVTANAESHHVHITADGQLQKRYATPAQFEIRQAKYT